MADMFGQVERGVSVYAGRENIVALVVGTTYPPSTASIIDLNPITLAGLEVYLQQTQTR